MKKMIANMFSFPENLTKMERCDFINESLATPIPAWLFRTNSFTSQTLKHSSTHDISAAASYL